MIYLFRNILNQEMKSFGSFLKKIETSVVGVKYIYSPNRSDYLSTLRSNNTYIIVSHGSQDEIYHRFSHNTLKKHQVLLDSSCTNNVGKIIAISCGTAKSLGKQLVERKKCDVYLGFNSKIHFDKKNRVPPSRYYDMYLRKLYKEVFEKVLIAAITNEWTFQQLYDVLDLELRRAAIQKDKIEQQLDIKKYKSRGMKFALVAVTNVANNLVLHGDGTNNIS